MSCYVSFMDPATLAIYREGGVVIVAVIEAFACIALWRAYQDSEARARVAAKQTEIERIGEVRMIASALNAHSDLIEAVEKMNDEHRSRNLGRKP